MTIILFSDIRTRELRWIITDTMTIQQQLRAVMLLISSQPF